MVTSGGAERVLEAELEGVADGWLLASPPLHDVLAEASTRSGATSAATRRLGVLMVGQSLMPCGSRNTRLERPPLSEHLLACGSSLDD
ncbi:hypothetical protein GCM10027601_23590 [Nocardioides ungokensis]